MKTGMERNDAWLLQARPRALKMFLCLAVMAGAANAQIIDDESYVSGTGERVQRLGTTLDAPVEQVWDLLSTSNGLRSWMAPVVEIELRNGGRWEASYDPTQEIGEPGNIINEVVAFIPGRLLVLRVDRAPRDYPLELELVRETRAIFELESLDDQRTRLTVSGVGYGSGSAWDSIYRVGLYGNRASLAELHKRIETGPRSWASEPRTPEPK
jgi:uncharacterized protein YndB with AHSA1/START domain